jgi:hypothetical protein
MGTWTKTRSGNPRNLQGARNDTIASLKARLQKGIVASFQGNRGGCRIPALRGSAQITRDVEGFELGKARDFKSQHVREDCGPLQRIGEGPCSVVCCRERGGRGSAGLGKGPRPRLAGASGGRRRGMWHWSTACPRFQFGGPRASGGCAETTILRAFATAGGLGVLEVISAVNLTGRELVARRSTIRPRLPACRLDVHGTLAGRHLTNTTASREPSKCKDA